jgi:putative membrane protein
LGATLEVPTNEGQVTEDFTMMGWYGAGMGRLGWFGMGVFWLVVLALVVWLVVRSLPGSGGGTTPPAGGSEWELLDRRLASGEIDQETWHARRAALMAAHWDDH